MQPGGIEPASTELGAGAEVSYSWSEQDGAIWSLLRQSVALVRTRGVVYKFIVRVRGELVADYTITKDGQPLESVERQGELLLTVSRLTKKPHRKTLL